MVALASHADALERDGIAVAETGATIHQTWQGLAAVYVAPEADQLLAATGPVMTGSASVGEDIEDAAAALRVYAADTADIQARLDTLRLQAIDLVHAYDAAAVAAQIAAWEAVQLRCANAIRVLTGGTSATTLVENGGGLNITPRAPTGPLLEIFPIDGTPPISSTGNPPVALGPGTLVNVPAPPATGIIDGPGSYQPGLGFGPYLDRTTGAGAAGDPEPPPSDGPGSTLRTIDDVLANPQLLRGKSPDEVAAILGNTPGWRVETLGRGRSQGLGWVLREYTDRGHPTGTHLRFHPGGGHHGPDPYWRVIGPHGDVGGRIQ